MRVALARRRRLFLLTSRSWQLGDLLANSHSASARRGVTSQTSNTSPAMTTPPRNPGDYPNPPAFRSSRPLCGPLRPTGQRRRTGWGLGGNLKLLPTSRARHHPTTCRRAELQHLSAAALPTDHRTLSKSLRPAEPGQASSLPGRQDGCPTGFRAGPTASSSGVPSQSTRCPKP